MHNPIELTSAPHMKGLWGVIASLCLACSSCGSSGEIATAPDLSLGLNTETLNLTSANKGLFVSGRHLGPNPVSTGPILLDGEYVLKFLPILQGTTDAIPQDIVTYLLMEGEETLLSSVPARPASKTLLQGSADPEFADGWAEIDLSAYQGRKIALKWVVEGISSAASVSLGHVRLHPKQVGIAWPDVLVICSDTHRYEYALGAEGRDLMPRLHALAQESVVYPSAYSSGSWTLPSMTSTLTG
jgi:hypothetical protein